MFKTMLSKACNAATKILLDGYDVSEETSVRADAISVDAIDQELGSLTLQDQEIEINSAGDCTARSNDGQTRYFEFSIYRALLASDVR